MASMFLQTQAKSVAAHEVVPTAVMMHGSEHSGKTEMSWAETAAARVRMAVVYFILDLCLDERVSGPMVVVSSRNERV